MSHFPWEEPPARPLLPDPPPSPVEEEWRSDDADKAFAESYPAEEYEREASPSFGEAFLEVRRATPRRKK